jgi:hypothetical protein
VAAVEVVAVMVQVRMGLTLSLAVQVVCTAGALAAGVMQEIVAFIVMEAKAGLVRSA